MKAANLDIQITKFLYSWAIVIYHLAAITSVTFRGGYCGVEYFLLTAGVFLFLSFEKGEQSGKLRTPGQYLTRRFCRFFPWSLTGYLLCVFVRRVVLYPTWDVTVWMDWFACDIWEILLIKWNGMNNNSYLLNGPAWTLSAMLIVGFFIWTFLYHYKKLFVNLIMPLTLVAGFGYWMHLPSADTEIWLGFTTFGTFRTWLIMCLSYYCLLMGRKLEKIPFNKWGKLLLTIVEGLIHVFALVVMIYRAERYYQWFLTLLFMISISIAMSGHSYLEKFLSGSRNAKLLGDLSMSVYLVHTPVIFWFRESYDIKAWGMIELLPVFLVVLIVSLAHYYGTAWLIRMVPKAGRKVMKLITVR